MRSANFLPTYRQQPKAIKPLLPMAPLSKVIRPPTGQRTMPLTGAPLLPQNPFRDIMRLMLAYRK
jgi:hypothetical protein